MLASASQDCVNLSHLKVCSKIDVQSVIAVGSIAVLINKAIESALFQPSSTLHRSDCLHRNSIHWAASCRQPRIRADTPRTSHMTVSRPLQSHGLATTSLLPLVLLPPLTTKALLLRSSIPPPSTMTSFGLLPGCTMPQVSISLFPPCAASH